MVVHACKPDDGRMMSSKPNFSYNIAFYDSLSNKRPCLTYPKIGTQGRGIAHHEGFAVVLWNKSQPCLKAAMKYWYWKKIAFKISKLISIGVESVSDTNRNHTFLVLPQVCFPIMSHFHIVDSIPSLSFAAEEQPAASKLMHPVGEPGSIDVSASLASTLAGFLSGASPSSWISIWIFLTAQISPCSTYWFRFPTFVCIFRTSHSTHTVVHRG